MKQDQYKETLPIPNGVQITFENGLAIVKGTKGEVRKQVFDPHIIYRVENGLLTITATSKPNKKMINMIKTFKAHLKNVIRGVVEGHTYKLKVCSGHFPMTVAVKGDVFEIKNFIGEKIPRTRKISGGVSVKVDGSDVIVEGVDKEKTSQMAALIEQMTRRPGFDKRIFQDGIYITEKDGKSIK